MNEDDEERHSMIKMAELTTVAFLGQAGEAAKVRVNPWSGNIMREEFEESQRKIKVQKSVTTFGERVAGMSYLE